MKGRKGLKRLGFLMALLMALVVMAGCALIQSPRLRKKFGKRRI